MSKIASMPGKIFVMALGVAIFAALGISMAYAQTGQEKYQNLQTGNGKMSYQSQGSQINYNYMAGVGHGWNDPKGMCNHGNATMSHLPSSATPSSTSQGLT